MRCFDFLLVLQRTKFHIFHSTWFPVIGGRGAGGRGGGGRGGGGRGGGKPGGFKGGKTVVIEPHRHEGIFIARGKEDALVTRNLVPGSEVYGEKRISVEVSQHTAFFRFILLCVLRARTKPMMICAGVQKRRNVVAKLVYRSVW